MPQGCAQRSLTLLPQLDSAPMSRYICYWKRCVKSRIESFSPISPSIKEPLTQSNNTEESRKSLSRIPNITLRNRIISKVLWRTLPFLLGSFWNLFDCLWLPETFERYCRIIARFSRLKWKQSTDQLMMNFCYNQYQLNTVIFKKLEWTIIILLISGNSLFDTIQVDGWIIYLMN